MYVAELSVRVTYITTFFPKREFLKMFSLADLA